MNTGGKLARVDRWTSGAGCHSLALGWEVDLRAVLWHLHQARCHLHLDLLVECHVSIDALSIQLAALVRRTTNPAEQKLGSSSTGTTV